MTNIRPFKPASPQDKASLRIQCKKRRAAIDPLLRIEHAAHIAALFVEHLDLEGKTIAGYAPIGDELDILPFLHALAESGYHCCLPVTSPPSRQLLFRRWNGEVEMARSHFGISTPPSTAETVTPDIVIVPLLGYTDSLHRIGYGGGFYDATLRALRRRSKPPLAVGVAFSAQHVAHFPIDEHDEPLDLIITEQGILRKQD